MKTISKLLLALAALLPLQGCELLGFKEWRWNQKLTVEIDTPNGVVSGSSVSAAMFGQSPEWFGVGTTGGGAVGHWGEAVVVEVLPGRYLFVLLKDGGPRMAEGTFMSRPRSRDEIAAAYDHMLTLRETRDVPPRYYPPFVTFSDVEDPATVRLVDPENLAASFGPGVILRSVTLSITHEPITEGLVSALLYWIPDYYNQRLDGRRFGSIDAQNRIANSLSSGSFLVER